MRRWKRSDLRHDRNARWLTILAGTVGGMFFLGYAPEMALADGITGRVALTYAHTASTATDAAGTATDSSNRAFLQQYTLTADKSLYPNLRLFASGLFQKTESSTSTNGQGSWGDATVKRPYIDLTLRTPVFAAGVNYNSVTTETKGLDAPTTTFKSEAYGGILGWKPEGLPSLEMTLTRSYNYDTARAVQDNVSDQVSLFSRYDPTRTVRLRYQGNYLDTQDRLRDVESKSIGNDVRIMYDDQYLRGRVTVSTYYEYGRRDTEITTSGQGTINFQQLAINGFFVSSLNPIFVDLNPHPASFLTNNDWTSPAALAITTINIGSGTGLDTAPRNIGLQFPTATELNLLYVWVYSLDNVSQPRFLDDSPTGLVPSSFTWDVYISSDNQNWSLHQTGAAATYEKDPALNPGVGRFVIAFPNVTAKFIKVVVSPLRTTAAGGEGSLFPNIYVNELQAFIVRPAADVTGKSSSTSQLGGLSTKVAILKIPMLYYDFSYFYNKAESRFSTSRSTTMSNALSVLHQFSRVFSGNARAERVDDSSPIGDTVSLRFSAQIAAVPLRTLSHTLGFSAITNQSPTGRSKNTALTLTNTAELYHNVTAFLTGGLSSITSEIDQKIDSTNYTGGINLIPIETLNIMLSSSGQTNDFSGGGVPSSTQSSRTNEVSASYYPFNTLYLFADWVVSRGSGQAYDRRTNYGLNWSPFPGGDLVFNFSYTESRRALDNSIDKTWIPSLRWNITRRVYAVVAYNSTKNTSIVQQSTTRTYSASLNMTF
jgi:hypothetical protein